MAYITYNLGMHRHYHWHFLLDHLIAFLATNKIQVVHLVWWRALSAVLISHSRIITYQSFTDLKISCYHVSFLFSTKQQTCCNILMQTSFLELVFGYMTRKKIVCSFFYDGLELKICFIDCETVRGYISIS